MVIKSILVDDEPKSRKNLRLLLQEYCPGVEVIGEATSPAEAIKLIRQLQPDLLFLDIEMGAESGFDLLRSLNGAQTFEVIFVTAFDKYGIQAVKACAIDYLLKPINILELTSAVDKALQHIGPKKENLRLKELISNLDRGEDEQRIAIAMAEKIEFVTINNIIRLQAEGNYTHIYLNNGKKYMVSKTLKDYDDLLVPFGFLRTHQSHLVNFKKIASYVKTEGGFIIMSDGSQVPVSRMKKDEILKKIMI
ncbi:two component transcriptional regulator, LytTR family [Mucilaginibacter pineti]|uniref:Two component transcriptional regulator, LytTR family n=1 Tax=Mucilaginibacter pineti TaxID=1391627 RepID=A0A1G7AUQ3_9SPHI|nr:LytTR family DNA-binding domain-containing protein [Mucilaginibacter pineti]SDE18604.1 two component transcriptional regulator, LytTR family [Mucilaginibacter pineti]